VTIRCPDCKHTVNAMVVGQTADEVLLQCPKCSFQWRQAMKEGKQ
jgi:ssDNA-binding Zn-finger/Zn-ribbon topoisomerase 1